MVRPHFLLPDEGPTRRGGLAGSSRFREAPASSAAGGELLAALGVFLAHRFPLALEIDAHLVQLGLLALRERGELAVLLLVDRAELGRFRGLDQLPALIGERLELRIELLLTDLICASSGSS